MLKLRLLCSFRQRVPHACARCASLDSRRPRIACSIADTTIYPDYIFYTGCAVADVNIADCRRTVYKKTSSSHVDISRLRRTEYTSHGVYHAHIYLPPDILRKYIGAFRARIWRAPGTLHRRYTSDCVGSA